MVPSIFSRRPAHESQATKASSTSTHPTSLVGQARAAWRARLDGDIARDGASLPTLSLTGAHPGGLAQLYTEHPVRLSLLIREPIALGRALERARAIIARSEERAATHGTGPVHLGIGTASWRADHATITVPALLRPVRLVRRDDDVLIAMGHDALLAPELAAALRERGEDIDGDAVLAEASGDHGFSSSQAMAVLHRLGARLPHFEIRDELVVGLFIHPASALASSLDQDVSALEDSVIIRALAGDQDARADLAQAPQTNPCDRDPWAEKGVGDLLPSQQDAVEAAAEGHSVFVDLPAHTDDASVVAAILADAAATGRSVLHVSTSPSRSIAAYSRLDEVGMSDIVANIDGYSDARKALADRVKKAMEDTAPVIDQENVDAMRARLREVRSALAAYASALHEPFGRFGVCAADALRALTDLTTGDNTPTTRVRLSEQALYDIAVDQGESARALLREALQSGKLVVDHSCAWSRAIVTSDEQASDVLLRVDRLSKTLPQLRVHIASVAGEADIKPAGTLAEWDRQLTMFDGIADVLDVFQPRVFERSAADMVIATAPKQWRKDHGISMGRSERTRLVKQAQDLVRPGVHVPDLHRALIRVQERRDAWCAVCGEDSWPILPARIGEILTLTDSVRDDLDAIAPVFAAEEPDLVATHLQRLTSLIERWASDTSAAREVPARLALRSRLAKRGLDELAQDLADRGVDEDAIDTELDLAWWASLLRAMLSARPALGGMDPAGLEKLAREGRELDEAQVASLVPQAITGVRRIRTNALAARADQYEELRDLLGGEAIPSDLELLTSFPLVRHLLPVLMTVPSMVPVLAPPGRTVDLVVLDGADGLPLAELAPIIARGRQLVVIDDLAASRDGGATRELATILPIVRVEPGPRRLNDQVALLLARYGYEHAGIPVPWTAANAPVSARWVDASGMPAPGAHAVESTSAEVHAVVDAVIEHAVESPERSLAVVALSERHAQRISEALEALRSHEPGLASFFDRGTPEPFVVVGPNDVVGLTRESMILSVGFAKTPHGRVIHDFGVLSTEGGADCLAEALRVVRGDLTLVSSLHSADVDRDRLSHEGSRMLVDLIEIAEGHAGEGMDAWPVVAGEPDRLLVDLADHLYSRGLEVVANVGIPGGMRVPLAIGHPDSPGRLLVAVLMDDEEYLAEPSQRVRDRARPRWLEAQGWTVHTVLSMALFIDPDRESAAIVDRVLDALDALRSGEDEPVVDVPERVLDDEETEEAINDTDERPESDGADTTAGGERGSGAGEASAPRLPMLDEELDEESQRRRKADEDTTGMLLAIRRRERAGEQERGPRPAIAKGLPLAAYSDDQLDEMAAWVRSDGIERTDLETAEELRDALGITRRGFQSDAVLGNVVRRTKPGAAHDAAPAEEGSDE